MCAKRFSIGVLGLLCLTVPGAIAQENAPAARQTPFTCVIDAPNERGSHATRLWEEGVVPFEFANGSSSILRASTLEAIGRIEQVCSVVFVERTSEPDYLSSCRRPFETHPS